MLQVFSLSIVLAFFSSSAFADASQDVLALTPGSSNNKEFACVVKGLVAEKIIPNANFTVVDNQNDPIVTGTLVKEAAKRGTKMLFGTISSQEALAAVANMTQDQTLIVPLASHPQITGSGKSVISMVASSERYAKLYASYIVKNHNKNETVFIVNNVSKPYSVYYAGEMANQLKSRGFKSTEFKINDGFANFDALISQVIDGKYSVIYMPVYTSEAAKIYSLLTTKRFKGVIYSQGAINDGKEFFEALKGPPIVFNSIWNESYSGPHVDLFKRIRGKYCQGTAESVRQVFAFDSFMFLKAHRRADGSFDFKSALKSRFDGVAGSVSFDKKGNALRDLNLFRIYDGKTKFLTVVSE